MASAKKPILDCSKSKLTERLFDLILGGEEIVTIQALLQDGVDINARDSEGHTPLHFACSHHREKIVDLLIKSGAKVDGDVCCASEFTVLHYASRSGWTRIVQILVNKVPNLDARDPLGETAMHHAARSGYLNIVKCLMTKGADIDLKSVEGFTPLLSAAQSGEKDVVDLLLNSSNVNGSEGRLVYYASLYGWTEIVQTFVKRVPDLNKRYETGFTALLVASINGYLQIVKCLVEEGSDVYTRNISFYGTALHDASFLGHLEIVKFLAKKGPHMEKAFDLDTRDYYDSTALHWASESGHLEIVKFLVGEGIDIDAKDWNDDTAMLRAAENNFKNVVDWLMWWEADVFNSNSSGRTLLHYASQHGWIDIVQPLVKRGCYLDAKDKRGITALGYACIHHQVNTVEYLLQVGASWDVADENDYLPHDYLSREEFIKLFIENSVYVKNIDYDAILKTSSLNVLQDVELCCKAIVNRFNNYSLPELYKIPVSGCLPHIEKITIASSSEVAQSIARTVGFEIQAKGHCDIFEVRPMALSVFSVKSVVEYYERKKTEMRNQLKRSAACDSNDIYQHSSKTIRLS